MNSVPSDHTTTPEESAIRPSLFRLCLVALGVGLGIVIVVGSAAYLQSGKTGVEKNFTCLCYPVGLAWALTLGFATLSLFLTRFRGGWWLLLLSVSIYAFGTRPLANAALRTLEESFTPYSPDKDAPLDALIVLGGGTTMGPSRPQAAFAGDRVLYAAELYQQGHAKKLITTGAVTPGSANSAATPSAQTFQIWTNLGIPDSSIEQLQGINTYEELRTLAEQLDRSSSDGQTPRIGLLTSAFHLPRALRLAKSRGLEIIPVAADFRSQTYSPARLVPHAENLLKWETVLHEYLAYFVAR